MELRIENVCKEYKGKKVLENIDIEFQSGIYGVLGNNGAGKTTLINIIVGILKSDKGIIKFNNVDVRELGKNYISRIGYLPQYPKFYKKFSVIDFLRYMSVIKDIPKGNIEKRINELLDIVNLSHASNKKIGELSGGMLQRVGIAQAMINNPDILILDEPTAGLDPQERIRFRNLILRLSEERIVLITTHIISDIEFIANKIILLKEGKVLKHDPPYTLINELANKVWQVTINNEVLEEIMEKYQFKISNMVQDYNKIHLRIIDDVKPEINAINVQPNLEDAFLYFAGEKDK